MANFYNIYNPAQGTANGLLGLPEFTNPVQFICGNFDAAGTTDNIKRTEICRQRMAPVLRRLMMNYPPIMSHGINTITAYKGQVIYDTPATEAKAQTYIPYLEWIPADGRYPPRSGEDGDISSLLLPPNPVPGPPPPAQPHTPPAPVILPPPTSACCARRPRQKRPSRSRPKRPSHCRRGRAADAAGRQPGGGG